MSSLAGYRSFTVNHHTLDSLVRFFIDQKRARIDTTLTVVDKNYFERTDGNLRGLIVTLEASELVKLIRDPNQPSQVRLSVFNYSRLGLSDEEKPSEEQEDSCKRTLEHEC